MFIMIRPNRKVPLKLLLWGKNKRLHPKGISTNNSRGQNTNQTTEINQQQPTDIAKKKITNVHEQHEFPMNLKWTRVVRKSKQFLPIAIHLCVSIIKYVRTLIRWRAKDLKQPQIICHLGAVNEFMMSAVYFFLILRVIGYHDNHWKNQSNFA
jgi:hypothetical protein